MIRAVVYDRCIDTARTLCARLRRSRIAAIAVHPTDFDRTFDSEGLPHLIVTELEMPMFSGFELIRQIRGEWSQDELPVIAYTAVDDALAWTQARMLGANEVVARSGADPVKRLEAAIARCLGRGDRQPPAAAQRAPGLFTRWFSRAGVAQAA